MIIIGVDTGLYTGMAFWNTKLSEKPTAVEVPYIETGTRLNLWLASTLALEPNTKIHVACERYVMTSGVKSAQPEALMGMGAVEYICHAYGVPLRWQFPRDAKKRAPDSLLRQLGWYQRTKDGHANDAQRHILEWMACSYPEEFAHLIGI